MTVERAASLDVCQGPADARARGSVTTSFRDHPCTSWYRCVERNYSITLLFIFDGLEGGREGISAVMYLELELENSVCEATKL
jgi:hypothetical protein